MRAAQNKEILALACLTVSAEEQRNTAIPHILVEHRGNFGDKAGLRVTKGIRSRDCARYTGSHFMCSFLIHPQAIYCEVVFLILLL
jgi:hypothetical protein